MDKTIDIALLRQAAVDAMQMYEAGVHLSGFHNEAQAVAEAAKELISSAARQYLPESVRIVNHIGAGAGREELIQGYIQIHESYARLKDALYRLMDVQIAAREWRRAFYSYTALSKMDPKYRDIAQRGQGLDLLAQAATHVDEKNFVAALNVMVNTLSKSHKLPSEIYIKMIEYIQRTRARHDYDGVSYQQTLVTEEYLKSSSRHGQFSWDDTPIYSDLIEYWNMLITTPKVVKAKETVAQRSNNSGSETSYYYVTWNADAQGVFYPFWIDAKLQSGKPLRGIYGILVVGAS